MSKDNKLTEEEMRFAEQYDKRSDKNASVEAEIANFNAQDWAKKLLGETSSGENTSNAPTNIDKN